jgi:hypothetical protein
MKNRTIILIFLTLSFFFNLSAQESLYKDCKLGDPAYYENMVKYIPDEELFNSLDRKIISSKTLDKCLENKNYEAAYNAWGNYLAAKKKKYFIVDANNLLITIEELRNRLNHDSTFKKETIKNGELVLGNEINGWGTKTIRFNSNVDFNTSEFGSIGKYGFNYWTWAEPLNYMFILTGKIEYRNKIEELFNDWYTQRYRIEGALPGIEIVFYELGLESRFNVFLPFYLQAPDKLKWITHERMLKTFLGMGRWYYEIEKKGGYREGNWQICGSMALCMLGLYFPEFKDSKLWIDAGIERIAEHLKYDFYPDGGHSERSPVNYTMLTYSSLRSVYYLLKNLNYESTIERLQFRKYFKAIIDWWISMIAPNQEMPPVNDSQRIKFPENFLLEKKSLFDDETDLGILRTLYGVNVNYPLPKYTSINHDSSGFAVMRSGWEKNSYYLDITYGKYGGFHTHDDLLSFEIHANGKAHIIDAAIGRTYDDTLFNKWYKTPAAHNIISIVESENSKKTMFDSTMDRINYKGENIKWSTLKNADYFSGQQKAYHNFGITHNRSIIFVKPFYWLLIDSIENENQQNGWIWNLHLTDTLRKNNNLYYTSDTNGIIVYPFQSHSAEIDKGFAMVKNDKQNDDFKKISWLKLIGDKNRKCDIIEVLLFPYRNNLPDLKFTGLEGGGKKIEYDGYEDEIYYSSGLKNKNLSTDAEVVIIRKRENRIIYAAIIAGTFLEYQKNIIYKNNKKDNYEKIF